MSKGHILDRPLWVLCHRAYLSVDMVMPRICREFWWGGPGSLWSLLLWGILLWCFKDKTQHSSYICLAFADYRQGTHGPLRDSWTSIALLPSCQQKPTKLVCITVVQTSHLSVSCRPWLCGAVLTNLGREKLKKWPDSFNQIRSVKVFKAPWKGKGLWKSHPLLRPYANNNVNNCRHRYRTGNCWMLHVA